MKLQFGAWADGLTAGAGQPVYPRNGVYSLKWRPADRTGSGGHSRSLADRSCGPADGPLHPQGELCTLFCTWVFDMSSSSAPGAGAPTVV